MSSAQLAATVYAPPGAPKPWRLEALLGHDRLRYYSLCRWALLEALRLAGVEPGQRVLLPSYLCREVVAAVRVLGAEPIYYELTPALGPLKPPMDLPEAKAVLAVDFFGFPQDLTPFREYAWRTGATIIEDNAHGLFSRDAQGHALGTRAPLGVFSLRKNIPLPDGGALAINDASLASRAPAQLPFLRRPAGRRGFLRALSPFLGARGAWECINLGRRLRAIRGGAGIPAPDPHGEELIPGPPEPCAELQAPITSLDPAEEVRRRRQLYALSQELLAGTGATPVFSVLPEGTAPYVYPFRVPPEQAAEAERRLNAQGLFSLAWPDLPRAVVQEAPRHYHDVRGVHFLW